MERSTQADRERDAALKKGGGPRVVAWSRLWFKSNSRFLRESYTAHAAGIEHANVELGYRRRAHTALAAQPDVTVIWQGWIDLAARDVADQEAVVRHLTGLPSA